MKAFSYLYFLLIGIMLFTIGCDKDPEVPNEEELITTLIYTLTPVPNGAPVVFSFRDLDGDGGGEPVVIAGKLAPSTVYVGVIQLLNESVSPTENITEEVETEGLEHQFFYDFEDINTTFQYADVDSENNPVGIHSTVTTGSAGIGLLTVVLRHLPDKNAPGVKDGDITNAGGETDIEVSFLCIIE